MNGGHLVTFSDTKLTDCEYFKQDHTVAPPEKEQVLVSKQNIYDIKYTYACASVARAYTCVRKLPVLIFGMQECRKSFQIVTNWK